MTRSEFATFAAALKTYYPRENILPNQQAMDLWYMQIGDISYNIAETVLNKWVGTEKWSPTIADIRENAAKIRYGEFPGWSEGWESVMKAVRNFGRDRPAEAFMSMSEITRKAVKRIGYTNICNSENLTADRANFRMMYEAELERIVEGRNTPPMVSEALKKLRGEMHQRDMIKNIEGGEDDDE